MHTRIVVINSNCLISTVRSTIGKNDLGPHVAVLCEYDALPEIGHACGHNLIAEVGVGAGIGIKAALDSAEGKLGRVSLNYFNCNDMSECHRPSIVQFHS